MRTLALLFVFALMAGAQMLIVAPSEVTDNVPANQPIVPTILNVNATSPTAFVVSVTTNQGGGWLTVIGPLLTATGEWGGNTPATVSVFVGNLPTGTYTGNIAVTECPTTDNSSAFLNCTSFGETVNVPVTVTIGAMPVATLSPTMLTFNAYQNAISTATQNISVGLMPVLPGYGYTATTTGGSWLSIKTDLGTVPGSIAVSANSSGLAVGVYLGSVLISVVGASNSVQTVPVTLTVAPEPQKQNTTLMLTSSPNPSVELQAVAFTATVSPASATGTVTFLNGGNILASNVALIAGIATFQSQLELPVGIDSIAASYSGDPNYNASQSAVLKQTVNAAPPMANITAVVNGADFVSPPAPGAAATVYGTFPSVSSTSAASLTLPTILNGLMVFIDGVAAPIYYISANQINIQMPWAISTGQAATMSISNGVWNAQFTIGSSPSVSPAVFQLNGGHEGAVLAYGPSGTVEVPSSSNPAHPGEVISIYCTGLGPVSPGQADGVAVVVGAIVPTQEAPQVEIGGQKATILFSGLAPGFVGLYQVNATVPQVSGTLPLTINVLGVTSMPVTIVVQ